jgi:hypothetical protein
VTVELVYNYDSNPLLAEMPLIGAFLPDVIHDRSDARING